MTTPELPADSFEYFDDEDFDKLHKMFLLSVQNDGDKQQYRFPFQEDFVTVILEDKLEEVDDQIGALWRVECDTTFYIQTDARTIDVVYDDQLMSITADEEKHLFDIATVAARYFVRGRQSQPYFFHQTEKFPFERLGLRKR